MRKRRLPFRKPAQRLWLSVLVLLCLVMNQWAVAAYACPTVQVKPPCHAHADKQQPVLCHQHCNPAPLSDVDGKAPTVPPALAPSLAPVSATVFATVALRCGHDLDAVIAASPPPIQRFCRYLI
jgi:hypothetical protein